MSENNDFIKQLSQNLRPVSPLMSPEKRNYPLADRKYFSSIRSNVYYKTIKSCYPLEVYPCQFCHRI